MVNRVLALIKSLYKRAGLENTVNDIEEIPDIEENDIHHRATVVKAPLVVFDLETTGLSRSSDITQLAACYENGCFSTYILPDQPISKDAAAITKITVSGNIMMHNGQPVEYKMAHAAITDFIQFLSNFKTKPVLVGHNIKRFDCHVLFNKLKYFNMWSEFCSNIAGFLDSLDLFKHILPGLSSYSQTALVHQLLGETYDSHNAVEDTKLLYKLVVTKGDLLNHLDKLVFPPNYPQQYQLHLSNLKTFANAIEARAISKTMALKAARSNLKLSHLQLSVQRDGIDGLRALLSEKSTAGKI